MSVIPAFPSPWVARFADLPVFPGKSILPEHDGDTSHLRDTAQEILDRLADGAEGIVILLSSEDVIHREAMARTGIDPRQLWPADVAAELLAAWRAGR
jgi:hypothetical protein